MVSDDEYTLDYNVAFVGLDKVIPDNYKTVQLNWDNYLEKLEKNASYERSQYSGVHYRTKEEDCSCVGNKSKDFEEEAKGGAPVPSHHSPLFKITAEPAVKSGVEATVNALLDIMPKT